MSSYNGDLVYMNKAKEIDQSTDQCNLSQEYYETSDDLVKKEIIITVAEEEQNRRMQKPRVKPTLYSQHSSIKTNKDIPQKRDSL